MRAAAWLAGLLALRPAAAFSGLKDLKIIDSMLRNYDRRAMPTSDRPGTPTVVSCEFFVRSLGSISEKTMEFQVDLYLRQHWWDPRLNHSDIKQVLDLNDPKLVQAIWKPEVYFPNAKEAEFQYVTVPNLLLSIKPMGRILYMLRLKVTFSCMMELNKYPLDRQTCTMEIASFSKTLRELVLEWSEEPVTLSQEVKMPQFTVKSVVAGHCQEWSVMGNYSCLAARFELERSIGFHLVQSYIPTILIVIVSWVSFWMDVEHVPGRVALGVTTLLTISSKSAGQSSESPQVSYVKALDVWMGACTAFVFLALIEFTLVNYLWRSEWRRRHTGHNWAGRFYSAPGGDSLVKAQTEVCINTEGGKLRYKAGQADGTVIHSYPCSGAEKNSRREPEYLHALTIDESCRYLFPLGFLLFNAVYWWYYTVFT